MIKIEVDKLIWDRCNIKHIKKHNVTKKEVEDSVLNIEAHKQGYKKRILFIGRSGKRILSVILSKKENNNFYVVTARDSDKKERRLLYEKENIKKNTRI